MTAKEARQQVEDRHIFIEGNEMRELREEIKLAITNLKYEAHYYKDITEHNKTVLEKEGYQVTRWSGRESTNTTIEW